MSWSDGSTFTNPGAGQVLVDTGSLPSGDYSVILVVRAEPTGIAVTLEKTNSAGTVVEASQTLLVALDTFRLKLDGAMIRVQAGQRLRLKNRDALTGVDVEASLFYAARPVGAL